MRNWKKGLAGALLVSLLTMGASLQVFAARIAFSDPTVKAGDEVTINMKITGSGSETINSSDVMLSYDNTAMEFIEGTGTTGGAGSLRVVGTAPTTGTTQLAFQLKFRALKPGTTSLTISTQEIYDKDGKIVNVDRQGSSAITITGTAAVEPNGEPTAAETTAAEAETETEEPEIGVALRTPQRNITVLPAEEASDIPEGYAKCEVTIDGHDCEGWIWSADADPQYCVFYAQNEDGERDFYRYDLTEKTLQRYFRDPVNSDVTSSAEYTELAGKYNDLLHDYELRFYIILGAAALAVVLLIVIIVLLAGRGRNDSFIEKQMEEQSGRRNAKAKEKHKTPRLSKEEQYLRDLEEEEDDYEESDDEDGYEVEEAEEEPEEDEDFDDVVIERKPASRQPKELHAQKSYDTVSDDTMVARPVSRRSSRPSADEDDDDFEVVDIK